jgi:DNA-binding NarL/FixJ family response regulator
MIVEDDAVMREALGMLIQGTPGYQYLAGAGSIEEALSVLDSEQPDVLLLDVHLPGMLGSEGVSWLQQKCPGKPILMLTVYEDDDKVFESICNGACGYLLKRTPPAKLLEAIAEAHRGGAPMSPDIARKVVHLFQKFRPPGKTQHALTPQEIRILGLLSEGYSYKTAAVRLHITVNTLRNYIRSVYDKLHVHSKTEAVHTARSRAESFVKAAHVRSRFSRQSSLARAPSRWSKRHTRAIRRSWQRSHRDFG